MPAKGVNHATLMERVAAVLELIGLHTDQSIIVEISKKWGISDRQARKYVRAAHRTMGRHMLQDRRHALELCLASYERIHQRALREGDYKNATEALDRIVRLLRLHDFPINEPGKPDTARPYSIEPNQRRTLREITKCMDDVTRRRGIRVVEMIEAPKDLDIAAINAQMNPDLIQDAVETEEEPEPDTPAEEPIPKLSDLFRPKQ